LDHAAQIPVLYIPGQTFVMCGSDWWMVFELCGFFSLSGEEYTLCRNVGLLIVV
jgi:hypothetical protein